MPEVIVGPDGKPKKYRAIHTKLVCPAVFGRRRVVLTKAQAHKMVSTSKFWDWCLVCVGSTSDLHG